MATYDMATIEGSRKYIRDIATVSIEHIDAFTADDLRMLYNLYDDTFFYGQIKERLIETDSILNFKIGDRTSGKGAITSITTTHDSDKPVYEIDISHTLLNSLFQYNRDSLDYVAGIGCRTKVECLQLIMEHELIHLLMLLWGHHEKRNGDPIYSEHGKLFKCMLRTYFNHSISSHDLGGDIGTIEKDPLYGYPKPKPTATGLTYHENSCYIDSLLILLFENISPFWRYHILRAKLDTDYNYRKICGKESALDSNEKIKEYAKILHSQLKKDYKTIVSADGPPIKCSVVRTLIAGCLPDMKEKGRWLFYYSDQIYSHLTYIFPGMQIDVPYRPASDPTLGILFPIRYKKVSYFNVLEYLESSGIVWDEIRAPVLVFHNGGSPRIKKMNELGVEKGLTLLAGEKHPYVFKKVRRFGPVILDHYTLVGVITLHGVPANTEGGKHYTSYFMGTDHKWYAYDDINAKILEQKTLPDKGVWIEKGGDMPSLYFYSRKI